MTDQDTRWVSCKLPLTEYNRVKVMQDHLERITDRPWTWSEVIIFLLDAFDATSPRAAHLEQEATCAAS
jgi:hypothetical protein